MQIIEEIKVILINLGKKNLSLRMDQSCSNDYVSSSSGKIEEVEELSSTDRGSGGFGSTGTK